MASKSRWPKIADTSRLFFTADLHFGHARIIEKGYNNRPFSSVEEMDEALVHNWNEVVPPDGLTILVGDVGVCNEGYLRSQIARLNGRIWLVRGNHDNRMKATTLAMFESVYDYLELRLEDREYIIQHYPGLTWNKAHYGSIQLHGHSHGSVSILRSTRIDVGVDCWDYRPIPFATVSKFADTLTYAVVDHHGERTSD